MNEAAGNSEEFYRSRIRELEAELANKERRVQELEGALTPFSLLPKRAAIVQACQGSVNFDDIDLAHKAMGEEVSEKDRAPDLPHTLYAALRVLHHAGGRGMRLVHPWRSRFWGLVRTLDTSRLMWGDETLDPEAAAYRPPCLVPISGYMERWMMDALVRRGLAEVNGEVARITEGGLAMQDELRFHEGYDY